MRRLMGLILLGVLVTPVVAGHSRFPYFDGGQSMNGRFVVTAELIEKADAKKPTNSVYHWQYTWKDTQTGKTLTGKLEGLRSGKSAVFDPVHAHVFVAPDGETFAVWNPQVQAFVPGNERVAKEYTTEESRNFTGFTHRLTVYKKTGEVVRRLDLKDFLKAEDWTWLYCYGQQVYWQREYDKADTRCVPRPGYALYRISPDYTILETTIGANTEATHKAKERNVTPPSPRVVRVNLIEGRILEEKDWPTEKDRVPIRPYVGEGASKAKQQEDYVPSLDPVRVAGTYKTP